MPRQSFRHLAGSAVLDTLTGLCSKTAHARITQTNLTLVCECTYTERLRLWLTERTALKTHDSLCSTYGADAPGCHDEGHDAPQLMDC